MIWNSVLVMIQEASFEQMVNAIVWIRTIYGFAVFFFCVHYSILLLDVFGLFPCDFVRE